MEVWLNIFPHSISMIRNTFILIFLSLVAFSSCSKRIAICGMFMNRQEISIDKNNIFEYTDVSYSPSPATYFYSKGTITGNKRTGYVMNSFGFNPDSISYTLTTDIQSNIDTLHIIINVLP